MVSEQGSRREYGRAATRDRCFSAHIYYKNGGCEGFQRAIAKPFGRAAARNSCSK